MGNRICGGRAICAGFEVWKWGKRGLFRGEGKRDSEDKDLKKKAFQGYFEEGVQGHECSLD